MQIQETFLRDRSACLLSKQPETASNSCLPSLSSNSDASPVFDQGLWGDGAPAGPLPVCCSYWHSEVRLLAVLSPGGRLEDTS